MSNNAAQTFRLSCQQQRTWGLEREAPVYGHRCTLAMSQEPDAERLRAAVLATVGRHDILRTVYPTPAGMRYPVQEVKTEPLFGWNEVVIEYPLSVTVSPDANDWQVELVLNAMAGDAYTILFIAKEIASRYTGADSTQEGDTLQYANFSEWQHELLASPDEPVIEFWTGYDYRSGNRFTLPFSGYGTEGDDFQPSASPVEIRKQIWQSLESLAGGEIQVPHLVMASFSQLLRRLTGLEEITIGFTQSGREYEELEETLGLVTPVLPVVARFADNSSLTSTVNALVDTIGKVRECGEYFNWDKETGEPEADYFHAIFETTSWDSVPADGFRITTYAGVAEKFDLKLACLKNGSDWQLQLYYDAAQFSSETITYLAAQLSLMIEEAAAKPDQVFTDTLATGPWSEGLYGGAIEAVSPENMVSRFEAIVQQYPEQAAVQYNDESYSYGELNRRAGRLAAYLKEKHKIGRGDVVAVCIDRSPELVICILGILKAGAAYLPIDTGTPVERMNYMLQDSNARLLFASAAERAKLVSIAAIVPNPEFWSEVDALCIPAFSCAIASACKGTCTAGRPVCRHRQPIQPSDVAYIIYTSGSTGRPKGVMISHGSLLNYSTWFSDKYRINTGDSTLLFSSVAFDLCYTAFWPCLISGATLNLLPEATYLDPLAFITELVLRNVSFIKLTPSHFSLIARDPSFKNNIGQYSLRLIVSGGEHINADDVKTFLVARPQTQFVNHYGPTETTIGVLTKDVDVTTIDAFGKKPLVGRPNGNNQVYILRPDGQPCLLGETGELSVSGNGVALGYMNSATLTTEKFIDHPFIAGLRLYRTGDLARWMPDGNVELIGRKDFQVKIRGYRIEIGEIEQVLSGYEGVQEALVQVRETEGGDKQLIAFLRSKQQPEAQALKAYLQDHLPHYMVPAEWLVLPSFALLPNGKVDRKALLELASKGSGLRPYAPARNGLEEQLATIWNEILGVSRVGIHDNFFDLGGHSLKAAQLVSRIYKSFSRKIPLRTIFAHPTIAELSPIVQNETHNDYVSITPVAEADHYEISHAQKRLWILNQFTKDKTSFNSSNSFPVKGELKIDQLAAAFETLIRRHESLRTAFIVVDEMPRQQIRSYEEIGFKLGYVDLRGHADAMEEAKRLAYADYELPFDLEAGPLLRSKVIQTGDQEFLLVCNIHHIIYDGWSLNILFGELLTLYSAYANGRENPLAPLKVQYKDYAAWHNNMAIVNDEGYWTKKMQHYPGLISLPYDRPADPEAQTYFHQHIQISREDTKALRELANSYNITLSNLFLSIYALFLNQVTGQDDILIGVPHANRNHEDTEKLIGFFINMLIMRIRFTGEGTLEEMVRSVSEESVAATEHSEYPFDLLIEKICSNRYADRQPLLNVMYDFKNFSDVRLDTNFTQEETSLVIEQIKVGDSIVAHDLMFHAEDLGETILYDFEYKKECFLPATVRNFYNIFHHLTQLVIRELALSVAE